MKKFRYSMENLLQVKQKLEDQAKTAYGIARLRLTQEEEKLEQFRRRKASYEDGLRLLSKDKLDLVKIRHMQEAVDIMKQKITQQTAAVKNAAQRLEVARIRLNNAMAERKIQEKLKEKAWADYLLEFDKEERKVVDELTSYKYSNPARGKEDR